MAAEASREAINKLALMAVIQNWPDDLVDVSFTVIKTMELRNPVVNVRYGSGSQTLSGNLVISAEALVRQTQPYLHRAVIDFARSFNRRMAEDRDV